MQNQKKAAQQEECGWEGRDDWWGLIGGQVFLTFMFGQYVHVLRAVKDEKI